MSKDKKGVHVEFVNLGGSEMPEEIRKIIEEAVTGAFGKTATTQRAEKAAEITLEELLEIESLSSKKATLRATIHALERAMDESERMASAWWAKIKGKYGLEGEEHLRLRNKSMTIDRIVTTEVPPEPEGPLN